MTLPEAMQRLVSSFALSHRQAFGICSKPPGRNEPWKFQKPQYRSL